MINQLPWSREQISDYELFEMDHDLLEAKCSLDLGLVENIDYALDVLDDEQKERFFEYSYSVGLTYQDDALKKRAIDFCHIVKEPKAILDFRTFDDNKDRKDPTLTKKLRGTIEDHFDELYELNQRGAGVFFTVNTTDGCGVGNGNIISIEYLWIEDDGDDPAAVELCPLTPAIKVKTSTGHYHYYFKVEPGSIPVDKFKLYQSVMAKKYGSDPNALDPSRVLRVAGFYHQKVDSQKGLNGELQLVEVIHE